MELPGPFLSAGRTSLRRLHALRHELRTHRVLGELYEVADGTVGDFSRDHGPMYAAAVAFYGLLSLVPLMVLLASMAGFAIHVAAGDATAVDSMLGDLMRQLQLAIPYLTDDFQGDVRSVIELRKQLGLFGVIALMWTASQVFRAMEFSLARVFARANASGAFQAGHDAPRNFVLSKLLFGAFITAVICVLLIIRFLLGVVEHFTSAMPALARILEASFRPGAVGAVVLEAAVLAGGYAIILKAFTQKRVRTKFALTGGLLFLLLFAAAREAYEVYLFRITNLGAVYGSFATIMTVVLWVYYLATVGLMCAYFARTLQRRALHGRRYPTLQATTEVAPRD